MKHIVLMGLFSLNLMATLAHAQPASQAINPVQPPQLTQAPALSSPIEKPVNRTAIIPLQLSTVAAAKKMKDDSQVRVQGQVIRALGKEKYEFRDATGTMIVEIDDEKWHGKPITQRTQVTLIGEIDRDSDNTVELDVDEVRILR